MPPRFVVAALLFSLCACSRPAPQTETPVSVQPDTPIVSVFRPFLETQPAHYVLTGETVELPPDAPLRTVATGPPPSGPITHVADIIELSDAARPQTYTLLPYHGEAACVGTTAQRVALVFRQETMGRPMAPTEPATSGAEALLITQACPFSELALAGEHPRARWVRMHGSHVITAEDVGVLDDIPEVFEASDVERLMAAPEGTALSRMSPEDGVKDVPLRVSVLSHDGIHRIWREGELLLELAEPVQSFIVDGDASRTFVLTRPGQLIPL